MNKSTFCCLFAFYIFTNQVLQTEHVCDGPLPSAQASTFWKLMEYPYLFFQDLNGIPAHILMMHPGFIFISPRFMLHSYLCQEDLLQFVKWEKVKADGLHVHFSLNHCSAHRYGKIQKIFLGQLYSPRKPFESLHKGWHHWPVVHSLKLSDLISMCYYIRW